MKITRTCACGKEFTTYPSLDRQHCSRVCSLRFKPRKPRRGTETPCETCGTPVYANQSERAKGQGRFCSRECFNAARTKTPVIKHCEVCGKEMRLKPSQAHLRTCSMECQGVRRTKRPLDRMHNGKPARKDDQGYVMVYEPDHPNKSLKGWQYEHRLVAERVLGRYLGSEEHVHHINGIKDDNRIENLEVMSALDHAALSAYEYRAFIQAMRAELEEYRRRFGPL